MTKMIEATTVMMITIVTLMTVTSTGARSVPPASQEGSSHLLFYLTVEKELVPQTEDLANRAYHLFQLQCGGFYNKTSTCLAEVENLPEIPTLIGFPSKTALRREGTKMFTKHLLKDVHTTLFKLQILLETEDDGFQPLTELVTQISNSRKQLQSEMDSFYQARLRGYDNFTTTRKNKARYLKMSRSGAEDCETQKDGEDCLTEDEYRLRLLYSAFKRLLRINHVLDYTVRLSWLAVEDDTWP